MSENGMTTLRCGIEDHGDMDRLFEDHRPLAAAFSLWICQRCGTMAVHLEVPGDIYWYKAHSKTRAETHRAGCAYCPTKFDCRCGTPGARHMCPRCDDAAEESKVTGRFPIGDPGERADEARQQKAYEAAVDAYDRRRGHA